MSYTSLPRKVAEAIRRRKPFVKGDLQGYVTRGGSYVLASCGLYSDDRKPHDLMLVQQAYPDGTSVGIMLRPNVHPDLVAALATVLVGE